MKICMLARSLQAHSIGGMELHIGTLAKTLLKHGMEVTIITTAHPEGKTFEDKGGVKIHYLAGTPSGRYGRAWWRGSELKFRQLHSREKFDLVHSQSAGGFSLLKASRNKKHTIPIVLSLHGTSIDEIKTKLRLGWNLRAKLGLVKNVFTYLTWDRYFIPKADAIIATSDSQVKIIEKYYCAPREKITLVYNGIDDALFAPGRPTEQLSVTLGIARNEAVIVSCARLKKEKGIQNMLSVFPGILNKRPDTRLLVIGDGEYRPRLEALAKELNITQQVQFLGSIDYRLLPDYFNLCQIFVNSTIRENGYDLTIPQGMSCGKPVVASDIRSVFSVIQNGENGIIYRRNDLDALKSEVLRLLGDAPLREKIGVAARETVIEKFGLDAMARQTIDVYEKTIRGYHGS